MNNNSDEQKSKWTKVKKKKKIGWTKIRINQNLDEQKFELAEMRMNKNQEEQKSGWTKIRMNQNLDEQKFWWTKVRMNKNFSSLTLQLSRTYITQDFRTLENDTNHVHTFTLEVEPQISTSTYPTKVNKIEHWVHICTHTYTFEIGLKFNAKRFVFEKILFHRIVTVCGR